MTVLQGFPPVADGRARVLILGSMPGVASLQCSEYYAHERNAFWRIMGDLIGAGPGLPYAERLRKLQAAGIALWDVIAVCERYGSLDADIVADSVQANDFGSFFAVHREICRVFFNGTAAEAHFRRHVLPALPAPAFAMHRLPSTSPAHAARSYPQKLAAWAAVVDVANKRGQ